FITKRSFSQYLTVNIMKKNKAKFIATWIAVPVFIICFILDIITVVLGNFYVKRIEIYQEPFLQDTSSDRIHFLNTANSDCILIESNGHFALIDSGEGDNNPRKKYSHSGFENTVIDYLNKVCKNKDGLIHLDFILGTHYHYDHVGAFHRIINERNIVIDKAYFKPFDKKLDKKYEITRWKTDEIASQIINDLNNNKIELISRIPEVLDFEDFSLYLFNTKNVSDLYGKGENAGSIGIKVVKQQKSVFLASDITASTGLEDLVMDKIGKVDILKAGHHGYFGSSSAKFLKKISPDCVIVTNQLGKVYPNVKWNFTMSAHIPFFATYDHNGIIATFTDDNSIVLTDNIH
ncbi:MAG: MBL fold metallo-hydrolase, partial [Clostridiales bacterium]|nr:MBL fold metallo-hydrolase [Clostridiales bacterium]